MTFNDRSFDRQAAALPWWRDRNLWAVAMAATLILAAWQAERAGSATQVAIPVFALAIVAGAYVFARAAVTQLIDRRRVGVELLVLMAGLLAVVAGNIDEAAVLAFLYALAKAVYVRVLDHARSGIGRLMGVLPKDATVLRDDRTISIPTSEVAVKDVVVVAPGARVPTDGRILSGSPNVHPSPLLGTDATTAQRADLAFAGSSNLGGELRLSATRVANDSALARITALLHRALESEGAKQRAVERYYLGPYTLFVLVAALALAILSPSSGGTWASSFASASAFMIAAASWALAFFARPPLVFALVAAARLGVFIKSACTLEQLAALRAVALSASTLAEIDGEVTHIDISTSARDSRSVIALAADVAHASGRADLRPVTSYAQSMGIAPRQVHGVRAIGDGVAAWTEAGWVYIVRPQSLEIGDGLGPQAREAIARLQEQGMTVFVIGGGEAWGFIAMRDKLRADATATVRILRARGMQRIVILAGRDAQVAKSAANALGIEEVCAPGDQAAKLRELVARHREVAAIVNDDVDDATLAEASVRIRLSVRDVAAAAETADVLMLADDAAGAARAVAVARSADNVVRQNLVLSLLIPTVLVAGVILGQWTLTLVAAANFIAVVAVVANAYRIRVPVRAP